ncbi:hypothetical protein ACWERM_002648 [Acinetobacter baumannii]
MNDQLNRELSLIKIGSWPGGHDDFIHFFKFTIAIRRSKSSTSSFSKLRPVTAIASKSCFELIGFNSRYIDIAGLDTIHAPMDNKLNSPGIGPDILNIGQYVEFIFCHELNSHFY